MATVGRSSLRSPLINKRVDLPHGYHLVIEDARDLHAIVKEGLFAFNVANGNTPSRSPPSTSPPTQTAIGNRVPGCSLQTPSQTAIGNQVPGCSPQTP
eukprot:8168121-Prorocentrum_lima.AAC.1